MSDQSTPPTEGDEGFQDQVDQRLQDKAEAGRETTGGAVAQEENKTELPTLDEQENNPANPGNADA